MRHVTASTTVDHFVFRVSTGVHRHVSSAGTKRLSRTWLAKVDEYVTWHVDYVRSTPIGVLDQGVEEEDDMDADQVLGSDDESEVGAEMNKTSVFQKCVQLCSELGLANYDGCRPPVFWPHKIRVQFIQTLELPADVPELEGIMQDLTHKEVLIFKSAAYSEALLTMTAQERRNSYFCDRALVVGEDASSTSQVPRMSVFPEEGTEKVAVNVCYMCADIPSMCKIMESRVEFTTVVLYGATNIFMNAYRLKNLK